MGTGTKWIPRSIFISGASSGIGRALALHFAKEGVGLALIGRRLELLQQTADQCRGRGAEVVIGQVDVRDREALKHHICAFDQARPLDLVIANAGVMEGTPPEGGLEPADAAHTLMETNVLGVLNTVQPVIPRMMQRGRGQIAIVSSIAAFVPLPDAPSYCASKAAVLKYGLSLRAALARYGVRVSVVCPGYVDTPMLARESGTKVFTMSAERAAVRIAKGLSRDHAVIVFPTMFGTLTRLSGLLPDWARQIVMAPFRFTVSDPSQR